jgi:hypothetical protein
MVRATWEELTAGLSNADTDLLSAFRSAVRMLPDVEERISRTEIAFARTRVFASGFLKSHRLELAVDLLRTIEHPLLLQAFHTTQKVITHRLTLTSADQLESVLPLLAEAHDTVGPGTR